MPASLRPSRESGGRAASWWWRAQRPTTFARVGRPLPQRVAHRSGTARVGRTGALRRGDRGRRGAIALRLRSSIRQRPVARRDPWFRVGGYRVIRLAASWTEPAVGREDRRPAGGAGPQHRTAVVRAVALARRFRRSAETPGTKVVRDRVRERRIAHLAHLHGHHRPARIQGSLPAPMVRSTPRTAAGHPRSRRARSGRASRRRSKCIQALPLRRHLRLPLRPLAEASWDAKDDQPPGQACEWAGHAAVRRGRRRAADPVRSPAPTAAGWPPATCSRGARVVRARRLRRGSPASARARCRPAPPCARVRRGSGVPGSCGFPPRAGP